MMHTHVRSDDSHSSSIDQSQTSRASERPLIYAGCVVSLILCSMLAVLWASDTRDGSSEEEIPDQYIYIVRHGDKYSSYPPCSSAVLPPCFNETSMGNNPPLTPCGLQQARATAEWLVRESAGAIQAVVTSPFLRCLETALPLATRLGLSLRVEPLVGEARATYGPFRPFNAAVGATHEDALWEVTELLDKNYGSFPIPTPEGDGRYWQRVRRAAATLRARFPLHAVSSYAVFTHATPSFSLAFGLCHAGRGTRGAEHSAGAGTGAAQPALDAALQSFVEAQEPIGPGDAIVVVLDGATGACKSVSQTVHVSSACGATGPHRCNFADYPAWYWAHSRGTGPALCS